MAAYPSYPQMVGSTRFYRDGRVVVRDDGGGLHVGSLYDEPKSSFTVKHLLSRSDAAALRTFYADNMGVPFDFVWAEDGGSYSCCFGAGGVRISINIGDWCECTVDVEEV